MISRRVLFFIIFLFGIGIETFLILPQGTQGAGTFQLVGTHPQASMQPTAWGKSLNTMQAFNGKLYSGYGDYGANTGPIAITPFDPTTNTFASPLVYAQTEEIENFRIINGKLYAPAIDPRGSLLNYAYAIGEPWSNPTTQGVDAVHVFDIVTLSGGDLIVVGSRGNNAAVWRSLDNGTTWQKILEQPPISGTAGDFARFYFAGVLNGKLYTQARDYYGSNHPASQVYNGTAWTTGPNLFSVTGTGVGWKAVNIAGKLAYKNWSAPYAYSMSSFDGTRVTLLSQAGSVYEYTVSGNTLYTLSSDALVRKTTDLTNWTTIATAPTGARSLALLNGYLYIGTTNSQIYKYSEPVEGGPLPTATNTPTPLPTATPTLFPSPTPTTYQITGTVYNDYNSNGFQDPSEAGISGQTIQLSINSTQGPQTTTDSSGRYSYTNLSEGNYLVNFIVPSNMTSTTTNPIPLYLVTNMTINFGAISNITPTPTTPDTIPPTVNITSPLNGALLSKSSSQINVKATDNVGISSIKIYVDSTLMKSCVSTTSCSFSWKLRGVSSGLHNITATATDLSTPSNSSSQTINVNVK